LRAGAGEPWKEDTTSCRIRNSTLTPDPCPRPFEPSTNAAVPRRLAHAAMMRPLTDESRGPLVCVPSHRRRSASLVSSSSRLAQPAPRVTLGVTPSHVGRIRSRLGLHVRHTQPHPACTVAARRAAPIAPASPARPRPVAPARPGLDVFTACPRAQPARAREPSHEPSHEDGRLRLLHPTARR